ncbi:MAG TPA: ABC transporter permease [Chloroflexota bacterium]|nr:ABC transporter permease [Chloroflexota bacterium]
MSPLYVIRRILLFFVVVWAATSLIFFLPKLAPGRNPIAERLGMMAASGGVMQGSIEALIKVYNAQFGLDQPLGKQYLTYMSQIARLDFGYSIMLYPAKVITLIGRALPWTIGLLLVSTLIAFTLGSILGALMAWSKAPRFFMFLLPPLFTFSAVPYYLLGLILVYLLAFLLRIFPMSGGSSYGVLPTFTLSFVLDVISHAILPALSIVLASVGFWAIAMRGMMVTTIGEDYMTLAEAKGLKGRRIFLWYAMRNAILPQTTALALSLGNILSGAILVEVIFNYPGMGSLLYQAVTSFDYFTIYGVVFFIIFAIALATLVLDLCYPLLDPRIRYQKS